MGYSVSNLFTIFSTINILLKLEVIGDNLYGELNHAPYHDPKKLDNLISGGGSQGDNVEGALNDKLFLTPLVVRGSYEKARSYSLVDPEFSPVPSYTGFLTVNITFNTNLFFWFFPAAYNPDQAPVILWLNGGPGSSSLFGLFAENGPYFVDAKGYLSIRSTSWALTHSVIYIDNPAGVGFSFTEDEDGFAQTQDHVSGDLYSALSQFFILFPRFQDQEFYIAGQSFAGRYLTYLAVKIHEQNSGTPAVKINMKGIIYFSPYLDPQIQADYGPFLQTVGLIDQKARNHFDQVRAKFEDLSQASQWGQVHTLMDELFHGDLTSYPTYYQNVTGFQNYLNFLQPVYPPSYSTHRAFLRQPFVRAAIHVGAQKYHSFSKKVMRTLKYDFHQSSKMVLEKLLDLGYKILIVAGQVDIVVHSPGLTKVVESLDWSGKDEFAHANRTVWRVNNEHAGFLKAARNLAFVVLRGAGHAIPHDKSLWSYTLVNEFTSGFLFEES